MANIPPIEGNNQLWTDASKLQSALEADREFQELLDKIDATLQSDKARQKEREDEKAAKEAREKKQKKILELRARIAELRSRLALVGPGSSMGQGMATELATLENELFWMMFSF